MKHDGELRCPCGARILRDDANITLHHEGLALCPQFDELIRRNERREGPHVELEHQQHVSRQQERAEVRKMVSHLKASELLEAAIALGYEGSNIREAALFLLREMRKRGWHISWGDKNPNSNDLPRRAT